jgi:acetylornithine/succinyldiaminopimelate/putrescine aminotransferase
MAEVVSLGGLGFLRTELETGLMLARIARSAKRADKRNRNLLNARTAYEAVLRFMPGVMLTTSQTKELKKKLERLKKELRALGEDLR